MKQYICRSCVLPGGCTGLSCCPRCHGWSHNPCDFCGLDREETQLSLALEES